MIRDFIAKEVVPVYPEWEKAGPRPREFYHRLGELGLFGIEVPEEYGGAGEANGFKYQAVTTEELMRAGVELRRLRRCTPAWCCRTCWSSPTRSRSRAGCRTSSPATMMTAIAMTEPGTGSRPGRHQDHREAVRGRHALRAQRRQDVHHRRRAGRPGAGGRPHRAVDAGGPPRRPVDPVRGHQVPGLRGRPQAGQDRPEDLRHRRAGVHRREGAGRGPARRGGQGVLLPDAQPGPRSAWRSRSAVRRGRRAASAVRAGLRQGAHGLRQAGRLVPEHQVRARRLRRRGRGRRRR